MKKFLLQAFAVAFCLSSEEAPESSFGGGRSSFGGCHNW